MSKWIHIAKVDNKLYASGKLTDSIKELNGYDIVYFIVDGQDSIWLKLRKK